MDKVKKALLMIFFSFLQTTFSCHVFAFEAEPFGFCHSLFNKLLQQSLAATSKEQKRKEKKTVFESKNKTSACFPPALGGLMNACHGFVCLRLPGGNSLLTCWTSELCLMGYWSSVCATTCCFTLEKMETKQICMDSTHACTCKSS